MTPSLLRKPGSDHVSSDLHAPSPRTHISLQPDKRLAVKTPSDFPGHFKYPIIPTFAFLCPQLACLPSEVLSVCLNFCSGISAQQTTLN